MMFKFWFNKKSPLKPTYQLVIPQELCIPVGGGFVRYTLLPPIEVITWIEECCSGAWLEDKNNEKIIHFPDNASMLQFKLTFDWIK